MQFNDGLYLYKFLSQNKQNLLSFVVVAVVRSTLAHMSFESTKKLRWTRCVLGVCVCVFNADAEAE